MIKVLMTYDMVQGQEEACQRYVMQTLAPSLARQGLRISDAWYTLWGRNTPQILGGGFMESEDEAAQLLNSSEWEELIEGLDPFVENFHVRVLEADGPFQA